MKKQNLRKKKRPKKKNVCLFDNDKDVILGSGQQQVTNTLTGPAKSNCCLLRSLWGNHVEITLLHILYKQSLLQNSSVLHVVGLRLLSSVFASQLKLGINFASILFYIGYVCVCQYVCK